MRPFRSAAANRSRTVYSRPCGTFVGNQAPAPHRAPHVQQRLVTLGPDGKHLARPVEVHGEVLLVRVGADASHEIAASQQALVGNGALEAGARRIEDPLVDRRKVLPRDQQVLRHRVVVQVDPAGLELQRLLVAQDVEEALHEPEVLHILPGHEVEVHVAVGADVEP